MHTPQKGGVLVLSLLPQPQEPVYEPRELTRTKSCDLTPKPKASDEKHPIALALSPRKSSPRSPLIPAEVRERSASLSGSSKKGS